MWSIISADQAAKWRRRLAAKEIKINSIVSSSDTIEQPQWQQVGVATTNAQGQFSLTVKPSVTTAYIAAYTKANGQIIARSNQIKVNAGTPKMVPIPKPVKPMPSCNDRKLIRLYKRAKGRAV